MEGREAGRVGEDGLSEGKLSWPLWRARRARGSAMM